MSKSTRQACLGALIALGVALGVQVSALAAEPPKEPQPSDLDKLVGQPADIAPGAYLYRADRKPEENPPETAFLFSAGIGHKKEGLLCGLLWEEPRAVNRVELLWPKEAGGPPRVEDVAIQWKLCLGATWWTRPSPSAKRPNLGKTSPDGPPTISADGRSYVYAVTPTTEIDNLVVTLPPGAQPPAQGAAAPVVRVYTTAPWQSADLEIEWGFQTGSEKKAFDGRLEVYNGIADKVESLSGDSGTRMTDDRAWQSKPAGGARRGVRARVRFLGKTHNTPRWNQNATIQDANCTIITVRTSSGSFSFMPADLESGPILAPEFGFFVAKAGSGVSAIAFQKELAAKGLKTIRQRTREHAEQSWEGAVRALHGAGPFPPYPQPAFEPPMKIDVPEQRLSDAWGVGAWHLLRNCAKNKDGRYIIEDHPYRNCGLETQVIIHTLDLMGLHAAADDGLARWITQLGKPAGQFSDGDGCFMDGWHISETPWSTQWALVEHYLLTGDKEWFSAWSKRIAKNADWIIRQRRGYLKDVPGRDRLWMNGLLPPSNIWDSMVVRTWYSIDAGSCFALRQYAEAIAEIDPQGGQTYRAEAEAYVKDLLAAVEKSLVLSPVIRVRDGTYRSFLPPAPYIRGPASRHMPTHFGGDHTPGLYADAIRGGVHFINRSRLLGQDDPHVQGIVDVLEDRLLLEHFHLPERTKGYDPEKDWFSGAGWFYQCGIERTPDVHLQWDDVPNFLRSFYNQYAVNIVIGPYTFNEHTTRGPADKSFEEAAFLERLRNLLVMEEGTTLWLARATPRAWLEQGKKISVKNGPTHFGPVDYTILSDVDNGKITAT
ncbi:MAG: hypothetical protein ABR915_10560, partial [Thermoguttaceae bacterium]